MTTLSSPDVMDDLLKWEVNSAFCRDSGTILNDMGGSSIELTDPVGVVLSSDGAGGYKLTEVGDETNAIALVLQGPTIPIILNAARSPDEYLFLARGPAIVNEDTVKLTDPDGTGTLTLATVKTALEARSIRFLSEPANIEEQTT